METSCDAHQLCSLPELDIWPQCYHYRTSHRRMDSGGEEKVESSVVAVMDTCEGK